MIEIYNEQVKDLFNVKSFKKGGLKVRQSKDGFIVQDLKIREVGSYSAWNFKIRLKRGF